MKATVWFQRRRRRQTARWHLPLLDRDQTPRELREVIGLSERLIARRGEPSGLALAVEIVEDIGGMDEAETAAFLGAIADRFAPDQRRLEKAIDTWRERHDQRSLLELGDAVEPPRQELFRRINMAPGGTAALVGLRARLLDLLPEQPELAPVDADLRHLLASWFNRGFLQLEQISWDSSAAVLERLIRYEAVHQIRGWEDLRRRLALDRRCYAFFHPALPGEPLIFVEVALTRGLPEAIGPLIDPDRAVADPEAADTAVFYSISNCQPGLRGVSFGNLLIKQVAARLEDELPRLRTFATLSPLPGFAAALQRRDSEQGFTDARLRKLIEDEADELCELAGTADPVEALFTLLASGPPRPKPVGQSLVRLALAYLLHIRRGHRVADSVAHFHLANGARLERVDADADASDLGGASHGVMVNYVYDLDRVEANHERYAETGRVATAPSLSSQVKRVERAWSDVQPAVDEAPPRRPAHVSQE